MKPLSMSLAGAAIAALAQIMISNFGAAQPRAPAAKESLFYCDQGALTPAQRERHFDVLGRALIAKRTAVHELPDGYEMQFPSDAQTYQQAAEYVDGERLCCPFFEISLRVMPERGPMWLRFTGRPGTKQFIEADAAAWIAPVSPPN